LNLKKRQSPFKETVAHPLLKRTKQLSKISCVPKTYLIKVKGTVDVVATMLQRVKFPNRYFKETATHAVISHGNKDVSCTAQDVTFGTGIF
jgi:hypothetical protein